MMVGQANVNDRSTRPSGHVVNIEHVMTHDNVICYIAVCAFIALTSCTEPGWSKLKLGPHCVFLRFVGTKYATCIYYEMVISVLDSFWLFCVHGAVACCYFQK